MFVRLKDVGALQNELKNHYIIKTELSVLSGGLALKCGRLLVVANALLITAKHVDFSADKIHTTTLPVMQTAIHLLG